MSFGRFFLSQTARFRAFSGRCFCTFKPLDALTPCMYGSCVCTLLLAVFPSNTFPLQNNGVVERQRKSFCKLTSGFRYIVACPASRLARRRRALVPSYLYKALPSSSSPSSPGSPGHAAFIASVKACAVGHEASSSFIFFR